MKICVLVTTMHQNNLMKFSSMNLQCDTVFANQCGKNETIEEVIDGHRVKMVSTDTIGLSRNRNIAIKSCFSDVDIVVFADDDITFIDGFAEKIKKEFLDNKTAEAIKFNIVESKRDGRQKLFVSSKFMKATRKNVSSTGVVALAIKLEALKKYNLSFDERFGAGTKIFLGEDSIFLQEMVNKKVKFFWSSIIIAQVDQSTSTWFKGFDEKYYMASGMVFQRMYPKIAWLLAIRSAYKRYKSHESNMSFLKILHCYNKGIKNFKKNKIDFN